MKIAIGSTNPVKVKAARNVMKKIYGNNIEIIPIKVESGVSHTPIGEDEIVKGAINRAIQAIKKINADLGIGMEGGIVKKFNRYFLTGWCAIVDNKGNYWLSSSVYMQLPNKVVEEVLKGKELGIVIDELTGLKDTKKKIGAIGIFTKNLMNREKAWEIAIIYAMVKKLNPKFYQ